MVNESKSTLNKVLMAAGIILVVLGLMQAFSQLFPHLWTTIQHSLSMLARIMWPLAFIAAGVLLVIAARNPAFHLGESIGYRRSASNCKIAGVCGGFAEYLEVDAGLVRLIAIVLLFVSGFTAGLLYLLICQRLDDFLFHSWENH